LTLPKGYDKNSSEKVEPSRSGKVTRIIGIILLIFGVLIFFGSLGTGSAAAAFVLSIIMIVISLIMIIRASRKQERKTINIKKSKSKAKHGFVIFLYFLAALALGYGLYSEYWLAGESLMESIGLGGILLIIAGGLDQDFGTYLWIRDIISNRQKKR
jgi:uncharacterized membrane protein